MLVIVFGVFHYGLEITNKWSGGIVWTFTRTQLNGLYFFSCPLSKCCFTVAERGSSAGAHSTMKAKDKALFKPG